MGSLHNIVSVCSGRAGAVPGKKNGFREPFREPVPMGSEVPGTGVPGSGNRFRERKVLRRFRIPEIRFLRFRKLLCTLKVYFCTRDVILLYFDNILLYFESIPVYFEAILLYFEL